jgi:LytS/YehU family sensor histidine kinase
MVRTRNNNSPWGEPSSFTFTIKKPFWNTWWFRGIGILITSVILVLIFRVQLMRVRKRAALETQLRNLEMKALKAQMNPHFIYNALNSIQSLVIDDKKTDALDYMVKFSRLLRQVLNHSELNIVNLAKELDGLKLYIQLESLRLNYSLNYSIKLDDNIIPEKEMIPPMILQPLVENALWHGLSKKEGNKVLYIYVRGEENCLRFDISDNGIGRTSAAEMKKSDTYYEGPRGIDITKTRLSLYNLNATFEPLEVHDIINQDNSPGGTIVTVRIKRQ